MSSALFERKTTSLGHGARMRMVHLEDPKEKIFKELGEVPPDIVNLHKILVAIYLRPDQTAGGIFMTGRSKDEDVFQGKVGLIVAVGPTAFVDDDDNKFSGLQYSVGDWVWFRPQDGALCQLNGYPCRIFTGEGLLIGRIPDPDCVW